MRCKPSSAYFLPISHPCHFQSGKRKLNGLPTNSTTSWLKNSTSGSDTKNLNLISEDPDSHQNVFRIWYLQCTLQIQNCTLTTILYLLSIRMGIQMLARIAAVSTSTRPPQETSRLISPSHRKVWYSFCCCHYLKMFGAEKTALYRRIMVFPSA